MLGHTYWCGKYVVFLYIHESNSDLYDILSGLFLRTEFRNKFMKSFYMLITYLKTSAMALMIV